MHNKSCFIIFILIFTSSNSMPHFLEESTEVSLLILHNLLNSNATSLEELKQQLSSSIEQLKEVREFVEDFDFLNEISPDDVNLYYYLPGANNYNKTVFLTMENATDYLSEFTNFTIIIHGWWNSPTIKWIADMAYEFNTNPEKQYNVLALDWTNLSMNPNYVFCAKYVKAIANILGEFLVSFQQATNQADFLNNVHLIGHSLGAQIAGFTGKYVQNATNTKIGWITAFDAAAPLFTTVIKQPPCSKLNKNDANFVDVLHTSIFLVGYTEPEGHVDFYVNNGGPIQPNCQQYSPLYERLLCSHNQGNYFYLKSINNQYSFMASKCRNRIFNYMGLCKRRNKIPMGLHVPKDASGIYYTTDNTLK